MKYKHDFCKTAFSAPAIGGTSGLNFNPRIILYIPVAEINALFELEQISADFENYRFSKISKHTTGRILLVASKKANFYFSQQMR